MIDRVESNSRSHSLSVLAGLSRTLGTGLGRLASSKGVENLDRRLGRQVFVKVVVDLDHCELEGDDRCSATPKVFLVDAWLCELTRGVAACSKTFNLYQSELSILGGLSVPNSSKMTRHG